MLGPKKKTVVRPEFIVYIEQKTDSNSVCVDFSIYTIYRTVWAFVILYTLRKFHIVFCPIIIYSTLLTALWRSLFGYFSHIYIDVYTYIMHICSRVSHSICANFAQFFGTWKIQLIVCCGFPCECTFSMLYLFISALRNAHWLSIYRAYTRTHTRTPDTTRLYVVWFLYSTIYFIWGRASPQ